MILKSIEDMPKSDQGVFDFVLDHLIEQGEACLRRSMCAYRNDAGQACAVGCLIPNSLNPGCWRGSVRTLVFTYDDASYLEDFLKILTSLQDFHDYCFNGDHGFSCYLKIKEISDKYDLNPDNPRFQFFKERDIKNKAFITSSS